MKRKIGFISIALAVSFGLLMLSGQKNRGISEKETENWMRQELPFSSNRSKVENWLQSRTEVEYGFVAEGKFSDYWFTSSKVHTVNEVKKLIWARLAEFPDSEVFFFFDKRDKLINLEILPARI